MLHDTSCSAMQGLIIGECNMDKEKQLNNYIRCIYSDIKEHLSFNNNFDDFDKAVIVKALINELNNDLVAYLFRIEAKKRGIKP